MRMLAQQSSQTATFIGFIAIGLWAVLALLTALSGNVPPFQLTAICFALATLLGMARMAKSGKTGVLTGLPWTVWALGIGGLFGYHFFYFTALRNAPAAEASLIAYLWPLLIVIFSALLPGESLKARHVLGGVLGLAGLAVLGGNALGAGSGEGNLWLGYGAAGLCALIWSSYSVLSRRFADVPTDSVTGFCAVSAILALMCHLAWESTVWPQTSIEWLAVIGLGLGPVGGAFYVWDIGVKRGNIQLLGVASYATPILSVIVLVLFGLAEPTWQLAVASLLVSLGALVASRQWRA